MIFRAGAPINGPAPPASSNRPLPPFPKPIMGQPGQPGNMMDMLKMAGSLMHATRSHQNDPHLSQEDNALALGQKVQDASGKTGHDQQLTATINELAEYHLPQGLSGFVVSI